MEIGWLLALVLAVASNVILPRGSNVSLLVMQDHGKVNISKQFVQLPAVQHHLYTPIAYTFTDVDYQRLKYTCQTQCIQHVNCSMFVIRFNASLQQEYNHCNLYSDRTDNLGLQLDHAVDCSLSHFDCNVANPHYSIYFDLNVINESVLFANVYKGAFYSYDAWDSHHNLIQSQAFIQNNSIVQIPVNSSFARVALTTSSFDHTVVFQPFTLNYIKPQLRKIHKHMHETHSKLVLFIVVPLFTMLLGCIGGIGIWKYHTRKHT